MLESHSNTASTCSSCVQLRSVLRQVNPTQRMHETTPAIPLPGQDFWPFANTQKGRSLFEEMHWIKFDDRSVGVILLPEEALRMFEGSHAVALAAMLVLGGVSQLISPLAGYASDRTCHRLGRRMPFILSGNVRNPPGYCLLSLWNVSAPLILCLPWCAFSDNLYFPLCASFVCVLLLRLCDLKLVPVHLYHEFYPYMNVDTSIQISL